jgi:hypothetical protein
MVLMVVEKSRLLVTAGGEMNGLVVKRLPEKLWLASLTLEHPGVDFGEFVVMAKRLALGCLVLDTEVTAARLLTGQGVDAHEFAELEEVGHTAGALKRLV